MLDGLRQTSAEGWVLVRGWIVSQLAITLLQPTYDLKAILLGPSHREATIGSYIAFLLQVAYGY
jgi:uncharacterized membrane protein